jgi:dienelactone hydrolase
MKSSITLTSGGKPLPVDIHVPAGKPKALVVIAYGSDGLTDDLSGPWKTMIEGFAEAIAAKGFVALIPDYLAFTATQPGPAVLDAIAHHRDAWLLALVDAADQITRQRKLDPQRLGLLGFSLGGHLSLRLRAKARVLVEFFAPVLDGLGMSSIASAHAQIHHGEADRGPGTGVENARTVDAALRREGTATELFTYPGAGHGFIGNDPSSRKARDLSKARTLSFFDAHL